MKAFFRTDNGFLVGGDFLSGLPDNLGELIHQGEPTPELLDEIRSADKFLNPTPDWTAIRLGLLNSPEYNLIAADCPDQRAVTRLEAYALGSPDDWVTLATLWNGVINSLPAAPPEADIAEISTILASGNLPVTLDPNTGEMSPN